MRQLPQCKSRSRYIIIFTLVSSRYAKFSLQDKRSLVEEATQLNQSLASYLLLSSTSSSTKSFYLSSHPFPRLRRSRLSQIKSCRERKQSESQYPSADQIQIVIRRRRNCGMQKILLGSVGIHHKNLSASAHFIVKGHHITITLSTLHSTLPTSQLLLSQLQRECEFRVYMQQWCTLVKCGK